MKLKEVTRSSPERGNPKLHATYTIKPSDKVGTLRISKNGVAFLKANNIQIDTDTKFKMFVDEETYIVAFKKDKQGQFRFTMNTDNTYRLSYKDLSKRIAKNVQYTIKPTKDYDLLFIPLTNEDK